MKQITNIYILVDTSFRMQRNKERLQTILNKYSRALNFEKGKAKLHIIGYNDKAKIIEPFKRITTYAAPTSIQGKRFGVLPILTIKLRQCPFLQKRNPIL